MLRHSWSQVLTVFALLALFGVGAHRLIWLLQHSWPVYYDGFYYLQEIGYRAKTGSGYYHSFSPFFDLAELLVGAFEAPPMVAFRAMVLAGLFIWAIAFVWIGTRLQSALVGLALLSLVIVSNTVFLQFYGHPRQAISLGLLFLGLLALDGDGGSSRPSRVWALLGMSLTVVAGLFHVYSTSLAIVLLPFVAWKRLPISVIFAGGLGLSLSFGWYLSVSPKPVLEHLNLAALPDWTYVWSRDFFQSFQYWDFGVTLLGLVGLFVLGLAHRLTSSWTWICWVVALGSLTPVWFPVWYDGVGGFTDRIPNSAVLLFPLVVGSFSAGIGKLALARVRSTVALLGILGLIGVQMHPFSEQRLGPKFDPEVLRSNSAALDYWLPEDAFVRAPHGVQFQVTFFLGRTSAREYPSEELRPHQYALEEVFWVPPWCSSPSDYPDGIPSKVRCVGLGKTWVISRKGSVSLSPVLVSDRVSVHGLGYVAKKQRR